MRFRGFAWVVTLVAMAAGSAVSAAPGTSPRPAPRSAEAGEGEVHIATSNRAFDRWIAGFRRRALGLGIDAATLNAALSGLRYNTSVIEKDRTQSEFTRQIWDYLDTAVSPTRIRNGQAALRRHRDLLNRIEARYGVDAEIVVAIWGIESAYGAQRGNIPTVEALATLAFDGRRGAFFESQLLAALRILQAGDVTPEDMRGSWAGAMGHTQFIPTSYLSYAVDFSGDGKRDIWSDDPTDALASTAAYLARFGWRKGQPWGVEVRLPKTFDYRLSGARIRKSAAEWNRLGVRTADGRPVPNHGPASILVPAGARGVAFAIFENFHVLERYNTADAYVIAVGHLADRIRGKGPFRGSWPRGDRPLSFSEKREMQRLLGRRGFDPKGADGIIGPNTIEAIRRFQASIGLVPDGYASLELLRHLR